MIVLRPREMRVLIDLLSESIQSGGLSLEHLETLAETRPDTDPMDIVHAFDDQEILNVTIVTRPKTTRAE